MPASLLESVPDMLIVTQSIAIPDAELVERFTRADGPGGQHVNRTESAVELRFDVRNSPSLTVSDGRQLWIYYPNFKSAERYPLGKGSPLDSTVAAINSSLNLEDVENTFQIVAAKIENGYELRLMPRSPSMRRVFQKLDLRINEQLRVERTDMLLANGDRIVTTYSNQTREPVAASLFEFAPPSGTEVSTPLGK